MKPNFALNLLDDGVALLHRTARGWLEVGRADLGAPDLTDVLGYLRGSALGLEPKGITTKLVIPNSQILYVTLPAPGPNASDRREQIRRGLEGRTPYSVDELEFDWFGHGTEVQVAVVARETLEEAEAFARQHRFNPVSFVAIPERGQFGKEPWFGITKAATSLQGEDERVERDQDPIQIVGREAPTAKPEDPAATPPAPVAEAAPVKPVPQPESSAAPSAAAVPTPKSLATPASLPPAPPPVATPSENADAAPAADKTALGQPLPSFSSRRTHPTGAPSVGGADRVANKTVSAPPSPTAAAASLTALAPPAPSEPLTGDAMVTAPQIALPRSRLSGLFASANEAPRSKTKAKAKKTLPKPAPEVSTLGDRVATFLTRKQQDHPAADAPARPAGKAPTPQAPASSASPKTEAEALTIFGARGTASGRKPRYLGLILTVLLLLFLAAIALWSLIFHPQNGGDPDIEVASVSAPIVAPDTQPTPPPGTDTTGSDVPTVDDEMLADGEDIDVGTDATQQADAPLADSVVADAAALIAGAKVPATAGGLTASLLEGRSIPTAEPLDEIYLASVDRGVTSKDPVSLPALPTTNSDKAPIGQLPPPPYGTFYEFDADGFIVPTPEGIITPQGVRLVAGRPEAVPPARPASSLAEAPATPSPETDAAPQDTAPPEGLSTFNAIPELAGGRPKARPAALAPADDGATLAGEAPTQFTSVRPLARSPSIFTQAEEARAAVPGAQDATLGSAGGVLSPLAVAVSRKPEQRPKSFSIAIEAALAAANQGYTEQHTDHPEELDEPEVTSVAPAIPTRASVAKQATFTNAINLSKINLIGVYGTASSRTALIRQSNGKYVKLKVGDKIDGGKVAAIGDKELRYIKNGKTLILEMPKG